MQKTAAKLNIENISEGEVFSLEEHLTERLVNDFAALSGDYSPLHMDDSFAKSRGLKGRVVHGIFLAGYLSRIVGMHLPGENAILQSVNVQFVAPAYIDDKVVIKASVDQVSLGTKSIVLKATIERIPGREIILKSKIQVGFTSVHSKTVS